MKPECIVLDEPTAMLDPVGRREVLKTILKLKESLNMTVILITHYMNEAAMADRMIVMKDGEIFIEGTPRQVFSQPEKLSETGLDIPQVTLLMHELKKEGLCVNTEIISIDECVEEILKLI